MVPNLNTIFFAVNFLFFSSSRPSSYCIHFHFIGLSFLAEQNIFPLQVAVHHINNSGIIVHISDDHRHGIQPCQLTGVFAPVPRYQLISAALMGPGNGRDQDAVLPDAFYGLFHRIIVPDGKGVVREWAQLRQRNSPHGFHGGLLTAFLRGEKIIDRRQLYMLGAAFQALPPPASDSGRLPPLCPQGHRHRCSCPRR